VSAVALKHCEKYPMHIHKVRPREDKRGVDLISDVLPFGRLSYAEPDAASMRLSTQSFSAAHTMP
jgi:hypothetical protein